MHHQITVGALLAGFLVLHASAGEISSRSEPSRHPEAIPSWIELHELETQTSNALRTIVRLQRDRDFELSLLFQKQKAASNHLDGDLLLEGIALEIKEVTSGYQRRIEEADWTLERLLDELDALRKKLHSLEGDSNHGGPYTIERSVLAASGRFGGSARVSAIAEAATSIPGHD